MPIMDSNGLILPATMEPLTDLFLKAFPELHRQRTIPEVGLALEAIIKAAQGPEGRPPPCAVCGAAFPYLHNTAAHLAQLPRS